MFIRGFLQSFFIVAILLAAGIIGYQATMKLWMIEPEQTEVAEKPEPTVVPITEPSVDDVSKNLIFCYDSESHIISKLILEVFHCERKQLTYITIPMSTQFTMTDVLYKKLIAVQPSIPQMIRLSTMIRYLDTSVIFDYGVLMIEDMLDLDISYYTVMPVELYQSIFEERSIPDRINVTDLMSDGGSKVTDNFEKDTAETDEEETADEVVVIAEVFNEEYIEDLDTIKSVEEISSYIETLYEKMESNLSVSSKLNYLDSYSMISIDNVSFTRIAGNDSNSGFVVDENKAQQQLQELGAK
jgi:general stress protein CsbA